MAHFVANRCHTPGNLPPASLLRWEKRRDQAHRRYLAAIKTLAQVRRLKLPALQVNVAMDGGQQVNVAARLCPLDSRFFMACTFWFR